MGDGRPRHHRFDRSRMSDSRQKASELRSPLSHESRQGEPTQCSLCHNMSDRRHSVNGCKKGKVLSIR